MFYQMCKWNLLEGILALSLPPVYSVGLFCPLILETSIMGSGPIDPKELLKGLDSFLNRDGEVKSADGISKIFR